MTKQERMQLLGPFDETRAYVAKPAKRVIPPKVPDSECEQAKKILWPTTPCVAPAPQEVGELDNVQIDNYHDMHGNFGNSFFIQCE